MIAFLDASALIYVVEGRQPFLDDIRDRLSALGGPRQPPLAVSRLSWLECRVRPLREGNDEVLAAYERFFRFPDLTWVELTKEVVELAAEVRARHRLQTPDALQAASALQLGPNHVFLAGDRAFRKVNGLNAISIG